MNSNTIIKLISDILVEKKARDICVIDIKDIGTFTDYFIFCTGTSSVHIKSLCDYIEKEMDTSGIKPYSICGYTSENWIQMDYVDIVVHIFSKEAREFYSIERIWSDGLRISVGNANF